MTQNTIENKQGFFALYIGQEVLKGNAKNPDKHTVTTTLLSKDWLSGQTCLELRSISQITDEEAIEVARILTVGDISTGVSIQRYSEEDADEDRVHMNTKAWQFVNIFYNGSLMWYDAKAREEKLPSFKYLQAYDYLRSRGFLLPFKDLSVEQILAYGWAQVKTS